MSHYLFFVPLSLYFYKLNYSSFKTKTKTKLVCCFLLVENSQELSNIFYEEHREHKGKDGPT